MCGESVQVLFVEDDGTYRVDLAALARVAEHPTARGLPVAVVSAAGATRGGKSFLLDFFLRYLRAPDAARRSGAWLGADNDPLTGFSWRGGCDRDTEGILLWSEPFVITLGPEKNNEKVAVVLMDTQGTFDSTSTVRDSTTVFAMSTLIASVQIYNLSQNIKNDDLQYLQLFTEYGKLAQENDVGSPFQVLQFLVRDWSYAYQHPIGSVGGQQLLEKRLEILAEQSSELREIRQYVRSVFETVKCFLLPHPGLTVTENPDFRGWPSDITPVFKTALLELIPSLLGPDNLTLKTVNGQKISLQDLPEYFKTYVEVYNSDTLPTPTTVMKATSFANLEIAVRAAQRAYSAYMDGNATGGSLPRAALPWLHAAALQAARDSFAARKTFAAPDVSAERLVTLLQKLDAMLPNYVAINNGKILEAITAAKEHYADAMYEPTTCFTVEELKERQSNAVAVARALLLASRAPTPSHGEEVGEEEDGREDEDCNTLKEELACLWPLHRERNEERISSAYVVAVEAYRAHMRAGYGAPCLHPASLAELHAGASAAALAAFLRLWTGEDAAPLHERNHMLADIERAYREFEEKNRINNEREVDETTLVYVNQMAKYYDGERCLHPEALHEAHMRARWAALVAFRGRRDSAGRGLRDDEFRQGLLRKIALLYNEIEKRNETRNIEAIKVAHDYYLRQMADPVRDGLQGFLDALGPIQPVVIWRHDGAKSAALEVFQGLRHGEEHASRDPYLDKLNSKISTSFGWLIVKELTQMGMSAVQIALMTGSLFRRNF